MTQLQFVLVAYDISHNGRRTKLHNALKDFGTPVQYSVFECLLEPKQLLKMKQAVTKIIKPRVDQVRYYPICNGCLQKVEITSGRELLQSIEVMIV